MIGIVIGGVNVFGGGLGLYAAGGVKTGGVGVSGDTSCTDHLIAWRVRKNLGLDHLGIVGGVSGDRDAPRQYRLRHRGQSLWRHGRERERLGPSDLRRQFQRHFDRFRQSASGRSELIFISPPPGNERLRSVPAAFRVIRVAAFYRSFGAHLDRRGALSDSAPLARRPIGSLPREDPDMRSARAPSPRIAGH